MKNFVRVIAVIVLVIVLAVFAGIFVVRADAAQDHPLKIWKQNENGRYHTLNIVDEATGVNYVVVAAVAPHGDHTTSISIAPRYNADGSLYTSK